MHRSIGLKTFTSILLVLLLSMVVQAQDYTPEFEPSDCQFNVPQGANVECGYVIVPENANGDPSDTVQLAVAIYRSSAENPQPDPVMFLQGGPGGGIVQLIPAFYPSFIEPITQTRDFVVFDQRGTGLSEPALNCTELNAVTIQGLAENLSVEETAPLAEEALQTCRERLESELGVNTGAYTSPISATDIRDIAEVLGYDQLNLYGGSYGTRLAQTVMRDYPELVRSAILDGAIPVELNLYEQQGAKAQIALDTLFEACASDESCNTAYPNLDEVYYDTVALLNENPGMVTITDPASGEEYETEVDGLAFTGALFFALQSGQLVGTAPKIIYEVSEGDYNGLITPLTIPLIIGENLNIGVFLSVNCHEEIFATTPETLEGVFVENPNTETFALAAVYGSGETIQRICENWGAAPLSELETEPVVSDIPTLIYSGQFDPATPPYFGDLVAENLWNSTHYIFPGQGHAEGPGNPCPVQITLQFLEDPTQEIDDACIEEIEVTFATGEAASINLIEYTSDQFGITTLIPDGWTDVGNGVFVNPANQQNALIVQAAPIAADELLSLLTTQLQLEAIDPTGETVEANDLTWTLYNTTVQGILAVDLALAESEGTTYLVLVQSPVGDRDANYESLFLSIVEATQS
jgi:pimeloyl-ACP methyl ester carboxylesterase